MINKEDNSINAVSIVSDLKNIQQKHMKMLDTVIDIEVMIKFCCR